MLGNREHLINGFYLCRDPPVFQQITPEYHDFDHGVAVGRSRRHSLCRRHGRMVLSDMVHGCVCVCVCVWPPVQDELLLSMRFQSLVLTSMTSPPYPRPQ